MPILESAKKSETLAVLRWTRDIFTQDIPALFGGAKKLVTMPTAQHVGEATKGWGDALKSMGGGVKSIFSAVAKVFTLPFYAAGKVGATGAGAVKHMAVRHPILSVLVLAAAVVGAAAAAVTAWLGFKVAKGTVNVVSSGVDSLSKKVAGSSADERAANIQGIIDPNDPRYAAMGNFAGKYASPQAQLGVSAATGQVR